MIKVEIKDLEVYEIVTKALFRTCTRGQVNVAGEEPSIFVLDHYRQIQAQKVIVFGPYPEVLRFYERKVGIYNQSTIHYLPHQLTQHFYLKERSFERFDFAREWNNLGYGRIHANPDSIWGVADLKQIKDGNSFVSVFDTPNQSVLWINRPVGLIDGFDWRLIEDFISHYRADDLICLPILSEVPEGYAGAVTMRIDCDEGILSGRPLFELYKKYHFPFSLAIKTEQAFNEETLTFMNEVLDNGGAILSHSHTHAPEWGEPSTKPGPISSGDAFFEATTSLQVLKEKLPNYLINYAVSPFHQNPRTSIPKLKAAGIKGFIGGIICNDPEFLMARGGEVPFVDGVISHSEQCMLHGDCFHNRGNSIQSYVDAFKSALATETFFGFLDHPFSTYKYGWISESERLEAHQSFLDVICDSKKIWLANAQETLDFILDNSRVKIYRKKNEFYIKTPSAKSSNKNAKVRGIHSLKVEREL